MTKFSANLGMLWTDLSLVDAIHAAKAAGFDAVECHCPYDYSTEEISTALTQTGLKMLSLNVRPGDLAVGDFGLAAVPGREQEARSDIDEAIDYAVAIGAEKVHVLAGLASGQNARECFVSNLVYACKKAAASGIEILIEPINQNDAPGYFLNSTDLAGSIIKEVNAKNLSLLFDCYHVQLIEGDLSNRLKTLMPIIGHIQFAGVPDRGPPDVGEVAYGNIFSLIDDLGYAAPLGAEYRPKIATDKTLNWLDSYG